MQRRQPRLDLVGTSLDRLPNANLSLRPMRYLPLALAALLLTGCQTIPVNCISRADYERLKSAEPPKIRDKLTGRADEDVRPIAGSAYELRSWGHTLLDSLETCSR
jgi:hypothetical protein